MVTLTSKINVRRTKNMNYLCVDIILRLASQMWRRNIIMIFHTNAKITGMTTTCFHEGKRKALLLSKFIRDGRTFANF